MMTYEGLPFDPEGHTLTLSEIEQRLWGAATGSDDGVSMGNPDLNVHVRSDRACSYLRGRP